MSLSDAVFDVLATIVAVGGPAAPRVYRSRLPQPYTLPALTFFRVDTVFEYAHDGDSGLIHPRWQVSCWASTNKAAETLARSVQQAFDTWFIAGTRHALPVGQSDLTDPETGVHQVAIDFIIWWKV